MVRESLGDQLRRIGLLPGVAITLAAALATFALLQQLMPISTRSASPRVVRPVSPANLLVKPATVTDSGGSADPLAAAQRSTERSMAASQSAAVKRARALARSQSRILAAPTRTRPRLPKVIGVIKRPPATPSNAPKPVAHTKPQTKTLPSGGASPAPHP